MIGKTISHYRILGHVGEGGMGVVYVAEDLHLGRRVAIKIPHAGRDESHYRARFLREARSVSKLRHPNIAAVHDYGETDDGQPFIVMELVSGQTLGDVLAGDGLSIARSVEVARETAEALSEAHRHRVVHRDIKPSNVVIDDEGQVKVLDFGLAKQLHEDAGGAGGGPDAQTLLSAHTRSDVVIGTPLYLSPEQARGSKVDGRSDLFALGALLYECLTGRPAFSGSNVIEIGAQVLHFDPPPPSRFNPRVTAELDRLTLKALAKRPEDRFQTAAEFASELARVRSRLPASDTATTRRLSGADAGHRSSALITMAEALRRPKFSPLTLVASLAALVLVVMFVAYLRRPSAHTPGPEAAALYRGGVDAMREGSYHQASVLLSKAVEMEKPFVLARARLAESLLETDFLDRARDEMLIVSTHATDFTIYPRADALYLAAVRSAVSRENAAAVGEYEAIVKLIPKSPQARLDLGRAYERNEQPEKAVQSYTEAMRLDPEYAAASLRLGSLHARQNNQPAASAALDRAQKLYAARGNKEGEAAVRYQRGRLLLHTQHKPAEAAAEFTQALALARDTNNSYQQVLILLQFVQTQDDGVAAQATATEAVRLAQASGMNDQVANGYITLGNIFFLKIGDYPEAERNYDLALQIARNNKLKRYEALAYTNLGSLRERQGRLDEADDYLRKGRDFFLQNGYRGEADRYAMLAARSRRQRGDYAGALRILEEMLRSAEQAGDNGQIGSLHRECGAVLVEQEKYAEALLHFRDSVATGRRLNNRVLLTYSLLNEANALWLLGRYEEAAENFRQLTGADPQTLGVSNDMLVTVYLTEAEMELSRRRFAEAVAKARQALALLKEVKSPSDDSRALAHVILGLAESFEGSPARGRALCEEAVRLAGLNNDPVVVGRAQFALARALLAAGDDLRARATSLLAQEVSSRLGRTDSEWRALAVAGKASLRAGDEPAAREYLSRAVASLEQFEKSLGSEAAGYLSRPDVKWLRGELGVSPTSANH
jgi:tetratricopeptide (TPR) repeat protein/predicted Ser/Thr protein kinase